MAQGKLKVKSKKPDSVKKNSKSKGNAVTHRTNKPIKPKKTKNQDAQKLKRTITKQVNKAVEEEIRSRVSESKQPTISKAQKAVAAHNKRT